MADNSWAERRRRMVKCKIHGLHYDPEMSTGCTRCLRDAAKTQSPSRPPQLVIILLCLLGMAFISLYIFGPRRAATGGADLGIASSPSASAQKLDPETFRLPVENLETALFRTPINETEDLLFVSSDISASAASLSQAILDAEPVIGFDTADQIARLGQAVPTDQVALNDVERARSQWLRIRRQRLRSADWLYQPSQAKSDEEETTSASKYSDIASSLRSLIEEGASEVELLNDPDDSLDRVERTDRWRAFARDWRDRIVSLRSRLPARPGARSNANLLLATQDLEKAISQTWALASDSSLPIATDSRFDDARDLALRAEQGFDDL
ncbi:MAG: hypothetical protein GY719_17470 [bacterium]|nr:hypothetical protein [bacterium]